MMNVVDQRVEVLSLADVQLGFKSWQEAICDVFGGRADVIEEHDFLCIGTVDGGIPLPTVIKFKTLDSATKSYRRRQGIRYNRDDLYRRDHGRCQYCDVKLNKDHFTVDHIMPSSRGGATSWENCVVSCHDCNNKKGNKTPQEVGLRLLRKPIVPKNL